jgi:hypothetical protein
MASLSAAEFLAEAVTRAHPFESLLLLNAASVSKTALNTYMLYL